MYIHLRTSKFSGDWRWHTDVHVRSYLALEQNITGASSPVKTRTTLIVLQILCAKPLSQNIKEGKLPAVLFIL